MVIVLVPSCYYKNITIEMYFLHVQRLTFTMKVLADSVSGEGQLSGS